MTKQATTKPVVEDKGPSKKLLAAKVFKRVQGLKAVKEDASKARKLTIDAFKSEINMTDAGAGTYYQNFKTGKKGWVVEEVLAGKKAPRAKKATAEVATA